MNTELLHKIQQAELEIAEEIFRICKKHHLRCSLVGGSAIGAIRHRGFIPWDDDIDLAMPREDYDRFVQVCKTELHPSFFLQCFDTEENCAFIFAKVRKNNTRLPEYYSEHIKMHQGIWVDIFIYDKVSDDPKERHQELKQLNFYRNLLIVKTGFKLPKNRESILNKIMFCCAKIVTPFLDKKWLQKKCTSIMTHHKNEKSSYIYPYGGAYSNKNELMPSEFFDSLIEVPFEGKIFKITALYDHYLTNLFGDYMTPPSPEKRISSNHFLNEEDIFL